MELASAAFSHGGQIPSAHTCDGDDVSPPLEISEVSEEAQSLVLIMDDPDVPKSVREDGMWDHWIVFNIPPETREVVEGQEPDGVGGGRNERKFGISWAVSSRQGTPVFF